MGMFFAALTFALLLAKVVWGLATGRSGGERHPDRVEPWWFVLNVELFRPDAIRVRRDVGTGTVLLSFRTEEGSYCETLVEDRRDPRAPCAASTHALNVIDRWLGLFSRAQWDIGANADLVVQRPFGLDGYVGIDVHGRRS